MGKKTISAILLLINFLLMQIAHAQLQNNMPEFLKQRFLKYTKAVPCEDIFLHFDREEYIAGEDLWFNIYLIDRQTFKPSLNSRIVYFELLNAENRPVVQKRILIDKGFGPGQIVLPDTLSAGLYTIRAYTNWMKNFLPDNCYMKDITVFNTYRTTTFVGKLPSDSNKEKVNNNNVLDKINNSGIKIKVKNSKPDTLEIFVITDIKFRSENNNIFYIFIQTKGNINHIGYEKTKADTTKISIPKILLSGGINQITLFNLKGEPVLERYIYTPIKENNFLTLRSVDSCHLRDKITLEIELGEVSSVNNLSNLSISVAPQTSNLEIMGMDEWLVFGTEYGIQPFKALKGRKINELSSELLDSILLNLKSNWINWGLIFSGELPHFKYQIEKEEHFILGNLFTNNTQQVHSDEFLLLCNPGKEAGFQYARTDSLGNFSFNIQIDKEAKDLIIMPDDPKKNQRIEIESSFSDQFFSSEILVDSKMKPFTPHISKFSVNSQVSKIYGVSTHKDSVNHAFPLIKPKRFYGKPDIELIMANYINLPVMEEVFFELLPNVSLKKKNSNYEILITDRIDDKRTVTTPCLMIDGVIIKDAALIINLDPENVEKIDIIKVNYVVGKYLFPGIINVITKSGDFNSFPLPDYMIRLPYRVIDPVVSFVSPDYSLPEMKNNRVPDYRNTLYWNPSVKLGEDGKAKIEFWSSDNKSDYLINIQGITSDGNSFSYKKNIKSK